MAQQYTAGQLIVPVRPDTSGAVTAVRKSFASMPDPEVRIDADIRNLEKSKAKALAELDQLRAAKADPKVGLQIGELEAKRAQVEARLAGLAKLEASPKVDADIQAAQARLATIDDQIGRLEAKRADPKIDANISAAESRLASIDARMDQLTAQRRDIKAGVDDSEVGTGMARVGARISTGADAVKGTLREKLGGAVGSTVGGELGDGISNGFSSKAAVAGAAGLAIGGAIAYGISSALTLEQSRAKLNAQLGLTAVDSQRYGQVAGRLYSGAYGESMDQVNEALAAVTRNIGAAATANSGDLERVSGKVLNLASTFGVDLNGATGAVATMMRTGLAPNADAALDILTRGFQQGGDKAGDLLDTMTEYPVQFQNLGLSGSQAMGLINQGLAAGARNSDLVADALKEFSIRAVDGSKSTAEGFAAVGLNASEMAAKIAQGGPAASQALGLTLDKLRAMPDPVQRSQAAVALFGTKAEDLGQALFALNPATAVTALGQVGGAADAMGQTLQQTSGARIEAFKRSLQTGLVDFIGGSVLPIFDTLGSIGSSLFGEAWGPVKDFLGFLAGTGGTIAAVIAVIAGVTWAWTAASAALNATFLANPIFWVVAAVVALVAIVVYAYNHFDWFRAAVDACWRGIAAGATWLWSNVFSPVFSAIGAIFMWLWTSVISPVVSWIASQWSWLSIVIGILVGPIGWVVLAFTTFRTQTLAVLSAVGAALLWIWQSIFLPAFSAIGTAATWLWVNVLSPVFSAIWTGLKFLGAIIFTVLVAPFIIAWNLLSALVSAVVNNVLLPLWYGAVVPALQFLGSVFTWLYQNVVLPTWNGIVAAVQFAWSILQAIWFGVLVPALQFVGSIFTWLYVNVVQPIWSLIQSYISAQVAALQMLWNSILVPALQFVGSTFTWLYQNVVLPIWTALGSTIRFVYDSVIRPAFDAVWGGLQWLGDRFRDGVGFIQRIWDGIRGILARPINFMIDVVWNRGILTAWNKVAGLIGIPAIQPLGMIPEFASGGQINGPGTGTSDSVLARVSSGEFVVREAVASRVPHFLAALNDGQTEAIQAAGGTRGKMPGYGGGRIAPGGPLELPAYAAGGPVLDEAINRAKAFAQSQNGKPYQWGGVGNPSYDCSGFMSAITNTLRGLPPNRRLGTTGTMPWPGFAGGMQGAFSIGNTKRRGHMAGTLGGVNVESGGSNGVHYGPPAIGADNGMFEEKYFLPAVGGQFVSGGAGGGGGSWFNPLPGLVRAAFELTDIPLAGLKALVGNPPPEWRAVPVALATKMRDSVRDWLVSKAEFSGGSADPGGAGVERWRPLVMQALARVGQPGSLADVVLRRMNQESGGNPRAINNWDVNARRGTPSKGLMQVIDPTFASNRDPGLSPDIWDPMANIVASMRYAMRRYGSLAAAYNRAGGYDDGGVAIGRGLMLKNVMAPERVLSPSQTESYDTLGTLVRELEAGRLPGPAPSLSRASIDSMGSGARAGDLQVRDLNVYDVDGAFIGRMRTEARTAAASELRSAATLFTDGRQL